jgi:DNA repair exonuclease SbcCD nuclease subunit
MSVNTVNKPVFFNADNYDYGNGIVLLANGETGDIISDMLNKSTNEPGMISDLNKYDLQEDNLYEVARNIVQYSKQKEMEAVELAHAKEIELIMKEIKQRILFEEEQRQEKENNANKEDLSKLYEKIKVDIANSDDEIRSEIKSLLKEQSIIASQTTTEQTTTEQTNTEQTNTEQNTEGTPLFQMPTEQFSNTETFSKHFFGSSTLTWVLVIILILLILFVLNRHFNIINF